MVTLLGFVALLGAGAVLAVRSPSGRARRLAAEQATVGLSAADATDAPDLPFALLTVEPRGISHLAGGRVGGRPTWTFDLWVAPDGARRRRLSCAVAEVPSSAAAGRLVIRGDRAPAVPVPAPGPPVAVDSERFHRCFDVHADDLGLAFEVLDPDLMGFLLEVGRSCWFEVAGGHVLCATGRLAPGEVLLVLKALCAFLDHLPSPRVTAV